MCDTQSMCRSFPTFVHPPERYPVAGKCEVACDLNRSRLKLARFEGQPLTSLGGNPVSNLIFTNGHGTDRRPAQEIFVP